MEDLLLHSTTFSLGQNIPNPCKEYTNIIFEIPHSGDVILQLFKASGELCDSVRLDELPAGMNNYFLRTKELDNGIYYCRLTHKGMTLSRSICILK